MQKTNANSRIIFVVCCLFLSQLNAQHISNELTNEYDFIILDSPGKLFTMRQINQNYLSLYRMIIPAIDSIGWSKKISNTVEVALTGLVFITLTHEEGHRSILTGKNIGSISNPFFNNRGAATVIGVTNETLKNLRDNSFPDYIRLHTAGLESDYMLANRVETLCSFGEEKFSTIKWEYYFRKVALLQYYMLGLFKYSADLEEEVNELERDIVGHDVYGAIRHLYRPDMEFYRYTDYDDLTGDEKSFVKRAGWRSLLNIVNPLVIGKSGFDLSESMRINAGLGYTMTPFGDQIDQNIWLMYNEYNMHIYLREFENKSSWFLGAGLKLHKLKLTDNINISVGFDFWNQPKNLNFNTKDAQSGGSIDLQIYYKVMSRISSNVKSLAILLGGNYKSSGYLPEEFYLNEHFGFLIGCAVSM